MNYSETNNGEDAHMRRIIQHKVYFVQCSRVRRACKISLKTAKLLPLTARARRRVDISRNVGFDHTRPIFPGFTIEKFRKPAPFSNMKSAAIVDGGCPVLQGSVVDGLHYQCPFDLALVMGIRQIDVFLSVSAQRRPLLVFNWTEPW